MKRLRQLAEKWSATIQPAKPEKGRSPGLRSHAFRPRLELLEDRLAPATFAEAGTLLNLDFNVASKSVAIVATASTYTLTLTGDNWVGTNSANVTGNGTALLTVTAAAFDTVNLTDSAAGSAVNFNNSGANAYSDNFNVTLDDVAAGGITFNGSSSFTLSNSLHASTTRNIAFASGSSLATVDGGITLSANQQATATSGSDFVGIDVNGGVISSSGAGNILLLGRGGNHNANGGIRLQNGGQVTSTATGDVTLDGAGAGVFGISHGVLIENANSLVSSVDGKILIKTVHNIVVGIGAAISSSGSGSITLSANQQATATSGFNFAGIRIDGATISTSGAGNILLQGRGGDLASGNHGIVLQNAGRVQSAAAGTITLEGTGGNGTFTNSGVLIISANTLVTSKDGAILVKGTAGSGSGAFGDALSTGVSLTTGGQVTSTGTAQVTLDGTGGNGTSIGGARDNYGVLIQNANSLVTAVTGTILVKGQGGAGTTSGSTDNYGVFLDAGGQVRSTGAAQVTLDGTGGTGAFNQHGVFVRGATSLVTSVDGAILVQGVGGNGTSGSIGVRLEIGGSVTSTGAAQVTLDGTGGGAVTSSGSNVGVSVGNVSGGLSSLVTSVTGDILLKGQGGAGSAFSSFNAGVHVGNGQVISAGTAQVTLDGTGGNGGSSNYGVVIDRGGGAVNSLVRSVDGAILVKGKAGDGTSSTNIGVAVRANSQVNSTGAATITIDGTGGIGTTGNVGVLIDFAFPAAAAVSSVTGDILITGSGGGGAVGANRNSNTGVTVSGGAQVASTGTARVTIHGTGGIGEFINHGVTIESTGSRVTSLDGDISITGQGGDGIPSGANGTFGIATAFSNAVTSTGTADVTLVADTINIGNTPNIDVGATNTVTVTPKTAGTAINLGGADAVGTLGLTDAELAKIIAGRLIIGDTASGPITISAAITRPALTNVELHSGGAIVFNPGSINTAGGTLLLHPGAGGVQPITSGMDATATTVSFASDLTINIAGTTVNAEYNQLNVVGTVNLTGVTLVLTGAFVPATGNVFVIVSTTSRTGLFTGLAENDVVTFNTKQLRVNYTSTTVTLTTLGDAPQDPPDAVNDAPTVAEDGGANTINVLSNDSPASGLTITAVTQGTNGAVAIVPGGGAVTYTPNANFFGSDSFTYTVSDGNGGTDTATVSVTVTAVQDPPDAVNDAATVAQDSGANTINVLSNDTFAPDTGETLTVTAVTQGTNGAVAIVPGGGAVTYTPNANFFGSDSFTYTISDGNGGTETATVSVTVTATQDPPEAVNDSTTVAEDSGVNTLDVLTNDSSSSGLTITAVTQGSHGTVAISGGAVTYRPARNFFGSDSFTYTVADGNGGSDTATVSVTVTAVNDRPVNSVPGPQQIAQNTALLFGPSLSFADVDRPAAQGPGWCVTLRVTYGRLTVGRAAGVTVTGNNTGMVTIKGNSVAAVNAVLRGLKFRPRLDFVGSAVLTMLTDDQGNTGADGPLTAFSQVVITVTKPSRGRRR